MYDWVKKQLQQQSGVRLQQRKAWWRALQWYFGYCSKKSLGDPFDLENGNIFLEDIKLQKTGLSEHIEEWAHLEDTLNWFFSEVAALDIAGQNMRTALRSQNMAYSTEKAYMGCLRRFQAYIYPADAMRTQGSDVISYLEHLKERKGLSASAQQQSYQSLSFFFSHVLNFEAPKYFIHTVSLNNVSKKQVPSVLSKGQLFELFELLPSRFRCMARLQYGSGLRTMELLRLRVRDINFDQRRLSVRSNPAKVHVCRTTLLPDALASSMDLQLNRVRRMYTEDLSVGYLGTSMPPRLAKAYQAARKEWKWQYVFPHSRLTDGIRNHVRENSYQNAMRSAAKKGAMPERLVTPRALRQSFATHMLENGADIHKVQQLLGHASVETTRIYSQLTKKSLGMVSPLDNLNNIYA